MAESWFAVLGEVDEDESVRPTEEVLERLQPALGELNRIHGADLVAPLAVSGSFPEFSGVLRRSGPLYGMVRVLCETAYPLAVRLVAARGEILSGLDTGEAESMDGPALDLAGELLYRARKEDRMLLLATGDPGFDTLFNALTHMIHRTFRDWTPRQWQTVNLYRRLGRQTEVAERLGITQQAVSNTLASAGWKAVAEAEEALERVLSLDPILGENEYSESGPAPPA